MTLIRQRCVLVTSVLSFLVLLVCFTSAWAMTMYDLNVNRRIDWTQAGYPGEIPDINESIINVREKGAAGDGAADDHGVIQRLIDGAVAPAVIFFPQGTYRLTSPLKLKSGIILRGEGAGRTRLDFLSPAGCLDIGGASRGAYTAIKEGLQKGSRRIVVADASAFAAGRGGEIRQENSNARNPDGKGTGQLGTPAHAGGQMVKIVAVNTNVLTIDPPLNISFSDARHPEIRPVEYIRQAGVEDLHIRRLDSNGLSNNINVSLAAECWFRRVESEQTEKDHIGLERALQLEIRECHIHDAFKKEDAGRDCGIDIHTHTTAVLVENNIFSDLSRCMVVRSGANGCVFGYNYARPNFEADKQDKAAISLYGRYPAMNLFEGNIVGAIGLTDQWGALGPGNTFFRNRVVGAGKHQDTGPNGGISVDDFSPHQNIIGNELTGAHTHITINGREDEFEGTSEDVLIHGNSIRGAIAWAPLFDDNILPDSFYLSVAPEFFGSLPWPAMGPDQTLGQGSIPALERFKAGRFIPRPETKPPAVVEPGPKRKAPSKPASTANNENDFDNQGESRFCFIDGLSI